MTKPNPSNLSTETACGLIIDVVRKAGRVRLRVSGTSMVPTLRPGDLITVEKAAVHEITPGEIVVFSRSGRLVVHRVTAVDSLDGYRLETRGDRMRRNDPTVNRSQLLGRVTQIERRGRKIQLSAKLKFSDGALCQLLRISDCAAGLYLRVVQT